MKAFCLFVAIVGALACRRVEPDDSSGRRFDLVEDRTTGPWYAGEARTARGGRVDLGPIDTQVLVRHVGDGPVESYNIRLEPEDTLDLLARWTGRPVAVLLEWNPDVRRRGLIPGEWFRVMLTPGEFDRLSGTRRAFLAEARALREMGLEVREVLSYTVSAGETLKDILERHHTSLDLMEKLNPKLRLTGVRPGQVLQIPILGTNGVKTQDLPGPKPPAPPPIPVPPSPPKPQTVQPDPAHKVPAAKVQKALDEGERPTKGIEYVVQEGDTAWVLARHKFSVGLEDLAMANPGVDLARLRPGMKLIIPKKP